jgi:hypothetical protein
MNPGMDEKKAFRHALMTVGLAVLLVGGFLLYLTGGRSDLWFAQVLVILVPALLLLPLVYRKYVNGPPPRLTPQQHLTRAVLLGLLGSAYVVAIFINHRSGWGRVSQFCYSGALLVTALDHLRRAYKKERAPSPTQ